MTTDNKPTHKPTDAPTDNPCPDTWTPDGPWIAEADKDEFLWRHEATNLLCFLHRNWLGAWCGFVLFEEPCIFWDIHLYEEPDGCEIQSKLRSLTVHGGVSFSDHIEIPEHILSQHQTFEDLSKPREGRFWSVGFSCDHPTDAVPHKLLRHRRHDCEYRTFDFAVRETESLATQLSHLLNNTPPINNQP